jgi:hypothetical protein
MFIDCLILAKSKRHPHNSGVVNFELGPSRLNVRHCLGMFCITIYIRGVAQ